VFTYRRNLGALKRIEEEFKSCKFEPDLNPRKEVIQSRYLEPKASPLKSEADRYNCNMTIDEEDEFAYAGFRAHPVPLFPEVTPTGIQEHLNRMQKSR
jgi:hypothetical protein